MAATTWQGALLARLRANAAVTALIGTKSYWEQTPQTTARPYVTLLDVSSSRPQTLNAWDLEIGRVQIDVWTDDYTSKNRIMDAVITALVPGHTTDGFTFQRADVALGPRDIVGETDGTAPVFRKTADLMIPHS